MVNRPFYIKLYLPIKLLIFESVQTTYLTVPEYRWLVHRLDGNVATL